MPELPEFLGDGRPAEARAVSALLFMSSAMTTLDAYSTLNSSPWTAESFGGDPDKLDSLKEYVAHAVVFSLTFAGISAYLAGSWMPVVGSAAANAYLVWLYSRAAQRAQDRGSQGWS